MLTCNKIEFGGWALPTEMTKGRFLPPLLGKHWVSEIQSLQKRWPSIYNAMHSCLPSDYATLLKWVTNNDEAPNSYLGNMIVGIQTLRNYFVHRSFSSTKGRGNRLANILAQWSVVERCVLCCNSVFLTFFINNKTSHFFFDWLHFKYDLNPFLGSIKF
jgi:hypothetical protein